MEIRSKALAVCAATLIAVTVLAQTPSFDLVGIAPGATGSRATALSADGLVAAGESASSSTFNPGFTWTRSGGRYDFGLVPGTPPTTTVAAISGDGSTVTGWLGSLTVTSHAYRRVGSAPIEDLGLLPGYNRAYGTGTNNDGSIVVGRVEIGLSGTTRQAFRWTSSGGMQGLGFARANGVYSEATGISRNGSTIVGNSGDDGGFNDPFVWRDGTMTVLPSLPGTSYGESSAAATNSDGSIVVGASGSPARATMWRLDIPIDLGMLPPGWNGDTALGVNDEGTVVVGSGYPTQGFGNFATIWTPATGVELLADYLTVNGVSIPSGWTLWNCRSVSADATVFAGDARSASGQHQGFVATIPEPPALTTFVLLVTLRRRSRAKFKNSS
jgi:uncharacterized membrane protein